MAATSLDYTVGALLRRPVRNELKKHQLLGNCEFVEGKALLESRFTVKADMKFHVALIKWLRKAAA